VNWKSIDDTPPIGSKFVVLYNDGSGARMFWRHDFGYIDSEGGEYEELPSEGYSLWTELPDGFEFWCEVRSEDPMTLSLPPADHQTPSETQHQGTPKV
jgi:hypothetical protein